MLHTILVHLHLPPRGVCNAALCAVLSYCLYYCKMYTRMSDDMKLGVFSFSVHLQLFDHDNVINKMSSEYVFTTEGHLVRLGQLFRKNVNKELGFYHRSRISGSTTFPIAHVNQSRHTVCCGFAVFSYLLPVQPAVTHVYMFHTLAYKHGSQLAGLICYQCAQ